jgi:hypothetical protein
MTDCTKWHRAALIRAVAGAGHHGMPEISWT